MKATERPVRLLWKLPQEAIEAAWEEIRENFSIVEPRHNVLCLIPHRSHSHIQADTVFAGADVV